MRGQNHINEKGTETCKRPADLNSFHGNEYLKALHHSVDRDC